MAGAVRTRRLGSLSKDEHGQNIDGYGKASSTAFQAMAAVEMTVALVTIMREGRHNVCTTLDSAALGDSSQG